MARGSSYRALGATVALTCLACTAPQPPAGEARQPAAVTTDDAGPPLMDAGLDVASAGDDGAHAADEDAGSHDEAGGDEAGGDEAGGDEAGGDDDDAGSPEDAGLPSQEPAAAVPDIRSANLNLLHGNNCGEALGYCRLADRITLLFQWIVAAGCPDVVTLQEVNDPAVPLLRAAQGDACPFPYLDAYVRYNGDDDQYILSRYPILDVANRPLHPIGFRSATFARIDHPSGPLDVFTTHLMSGGDGISGSGDDPCADLGAANPFLWFCPAECAAEGEVTRRECEAIQLLRFVDEKHTGGGVALVTGDLNDPPTGPSYRRLIDAGLIDTHIAAGNPECSAAAPSSCTGVRAASLTSLESPTAPTGGVRVDYTLTLPPTSALACVARVEPLGDLDDDGMGTGTFAATSNPFSTTCGAPPAPPCWVSDHAGTQADLSCSAGL